MAKKKIGEVLQEFGVVTESDIEDALKEQAETGKILGEILVEKGIVSTRDLWQAWQGQVAHSPEAIYGISVPKKISELALGELASIYSILPLYESEGKLTVVVMRPQDVTVIDDIQVFLDSDVASVIAANKAVADAVRKHHPDMELRKCDMCGEVLEDPDTMVFFNSKKRQLVIVCKKCFPEQEKKKI